MSQYALAQGPLGDVVEPAAQVAHHPAGVALQCTQRLAHPLELTGVGVSADLRRQPRRQARIALAQLDPGLGGERHQLPPRRLVEPGVGRIRDGLLHHRGVDRHPLQALVLDRPRGAAGVDRLRQQPLHALLADALAPAGERRGIDRRTMLEERLTAEMLVVWVLDPPCDHRLVRQLEGVLEIEQPGHQSRRCRRPPVGPTGRTRPTPARRTPSRSAPRASPIRGACRSGRPGVVAGDHPVRVGGALASSAHPKSQGSRRNSTKPCNQEPRELRLIVRNQRHARCSG